MGILNFKIKDSLKLRKFAGIDFIGANMGGGK